MNEKIIDPVDTDIIEAELKPEYFLRKTNKGNNDIYVITAKNCPGVMREIGRLREISFRLAGRNAFSEAFRNANPKVLEPVYDVEVFVPGDVMGDVMSDLQGRRAIIMGMDSDSGFQKIKARVPLAEMASYSTTLSSITGGRSSFSLTFAGYELVPGDVQEKLLKAYAEKQAEE